MLGSIQQAERTDAAYCLGLAINHPFIDSNKRSALTAADRFLEPNGYKPKALKADAVIVIFEYKNADPLDVFAGLIGISWIRSRLAKTKSAIIVGNHFCAFVV